ncbi:flagellar export chaperone FliS [Halomonas sp. IOP_31]|uniref:flagellar export chaperone FliS n=1 Tax=Halomonas sp. IOP_31 TaxID=2876584 RepID=UPI001E28EAAF|nr:flagellar export chaperone FliS [Halomonas sp. IOP_31]MCD6008378.1 flagellar export chaperone FliS [Halomonas sp. IOP_31]
MSTMRGANAYARMGVETGVMSASPHQLIVMLFDGAQASLRAARLHLQQGNMAEKGKALSKAIDIVNNGLSASLDHDKGGEIAGRLVSLYDYVVRLLMQANLHNDLQRIDEAARLLDDIGTAWRDIAPAARS